MAFVPPASLDIHSNVENFHSLLDRPDSDLGLHGGPGRLKRYWYGGFLLPVCILFDPSVVI